MDPQFDLSCLGDGRITGISAAGGSALAEAAAVCLRGEGHRSPTPIAVEGDIEGGMARMWPAPTERSRLFWDDQPRATEWGAEAVAIAVIETLTEWTVVDRAQRGTGYDYWLALKGGEEEPFNRLAKLEVAGLRTATGAQARRKLEEKANQVERSRRDLEGLALVVQFGPKESGLETPRVVARIKR